MPEAKRRNHPARLAAGLNDREATLLSRFSVQAQSVMWDFDEDGGAQGDVNFSVRLPPTSVVTAVYSDTQTAINSSGGSTTLQLKAGTTDLTDAEAEAKFDSGGEQHKLALASSAEAIKTSDAEELKLTIAGEDATAGKVKFTVYFHTSDGTP